MNSTTLAHPGQDTAHQARVASIRDGAICRQELGQATRHVLLPSGMHEVTTLDGLTGMVTVYVGSSLAETVTKAKRGTERAPQPLGHQSQELPRERRSP